MSTLGGTRGERNAKPKFAALDINKLYITSRGESLEPSSQKSAVPRKHGMQSLGKVPTARRPPANLPSLKAEVGNPGEQSGSWTNDHNEGQHLIKSSSDLTENNITSLNSSISNSNAQHQISSLSNSKSCESSWNTNEFPSLDGTGPYGGNINNKSQLFQDPGGASQTISRHPNDTAGRIPQKRSVGRTALSNIATEDIDGGGAHSLGGTNNFQGTTASSQSPPLPPQFRALLPPFMQRGSDSGLTGNENEGGTSSLPALSPVSHLSTSGMGNDSRNNNIVFNSNVGSNLDNSKMNNNSGNISSVKKKVNNEGTGNSSSSFGTGNLTTNVTKISNQFPQKQPSGLTTHSQQQQNVRIGGGNNFSSMPTAKRGRVVRGASGASSNIGREGSAEIASGTAYNDNYQHANRRGGMNHQPRYANRNTAVSTGNYNSAVGHVRSSGSGNVVVSGDAGSPCGFHDDNRNSHPPYGSSVLDQEVMVRPIIRDEELQRLEAIAKDEGWAKDYEFDYNQKLEFSDDESEINPSSIALKEKDNAIETLEKNVMGVNDEKVNDPDKIDKHDRTQETVGVGHRDREVSDGSSIQANANSGGMRVIGVEGSVINVNIVAGGLEAAEAKERIKQRREEDQRREIERKQAAARKLQELEEKLNRKKNDESVDGRPGNNDKNIGGVNVSVTSTGNVVTPLTGNLMEEEKALESVSEYSSERIISVKIRGKSDERANAKEMWYEFGASGARHDREGGNISGSTSTNWDMPGFSKTFQSNLPPRFQKRKFERNTSGTNLSTANNTTSNQTLSRNANSYSPGSSGPTVTNSVSETKSTIPFAQQYDPRFIHNQQTYGRTVSANAMSSSRRSATTTTSAPVRDREDRQRQQYEIREHNQREATKEKQDFAEDNNRFNVAFAGSPESSANNHLKQNTGERITPQLVRSLSESSNRKTSVSSDENHHNIAHHPHHTTSSTHNSGSIATMPVNYGREISWDTEVERVSSTSSPASFTGSERPLRSDCEQPKQILHRVKEVTSQISNVTKEDKMSSRMTKNVDCESNQKIEQIERSEHSLSDSVAALQDNNTNNSNVTMDSGDNKVDKAAEKLNKLLLSEEPSTFGDVEANMKENVESCLNECSKDVAHLDTHQSRSLSGTNDKKLIASTTTVCASSQQHGGKKKGMTLIHQQHSRDNRRHDTRGGSRGGSYSGGYHHADITGGSSVRGGTSNWNRSRGGSRISGGSRSHNSDYWSESEFSEEGFDEQSKHHLHQKIYSHSMVGSAGIQSSVSADTAGIISKEGFVPRGEPSRRGRGGGNVGSNVIVASSSNTNNRQKQQQTPFSAGLSSMDGNGSISKKIEGYGPPNAKSPFGGGTGNIDDRNAKHRVGESLNSNISVASPTRDDRTVQKSVRPISFSDTTKATEDVLPSDQEKNSAIGEGKPVAMEVHNDESHSREDNLISQKSGARSNVAENRVPLETSDASDIIKSGTLVEDIKIKTKGIVTPITTKSASSIASQQQSKNATTLPGTINSGNSSSLDSNFALQGNATVANIGNTRGGGNNLLVTRKQQSASRGQGVKASNTDTTTDISPGPCSNTIQTAPTLMNINNSGNKTAATLVTRPSTISLEGERSCHLQQQSATEKLSAPSPVNNAKTDNDKHNLDGNTPPVNTIIFENTNYKSGISVAVLGGNSSSPVVGDCGGVGGDATITSLRRQHSGNNVTNFGPKVNTGLINDKMTTGAAGVVGGMINSQQSMTSCSSAHRPIATSTVTTADECSLQHNIVGSSQRIALSTGAPKQQPCNMITSSLQGIPFQKNENDYKDIKSYAFETDISHLIDGDKGIKQQSSVSAGLCLSKSIEAEGGGNSHGAGTVSVKNMISPSTADLNMKIASVKKVWEMPTVPEQTGTVVNTGSGSSANRVNVGNEHSVSGGGNVASGSNVHMKSNFGRGPHHPSHQPQYQHPHPGGTSHHAHQTHGTHSSYGAFGSDSDSLVDHFNNSKSVCNVSGSAGSNSGCDINSTITLNNECNDSSNGGYSLGHHHSQQQPAKPHPQTHQQQLQQQHHQQELQHQRQPHNMQETSTQQSSQQHTQQPQKQLQQHQSQHALQQHAQQLQRQQQQHKDQPQHLQQLQQLHQQSQPQHKSQTQSQSQPQQSQSQTQNASQSQSQPQSQTQPSQSQSQLQAQTQPQMKTQQQQSLQQVQQLSQQLPQQLSQSQSQQHPHQQQHPPHKQSQLQQQLQQHPVQQHPQQLQQSHHQQSLQLQHQQQTQQSQQHVTSVGVQQHQAAVAVSLGLNKHPVADVLAAAVAANNVNVCKVKPTQQNNGAGMHQSSGMGLSPPPQMQSGSIPSAPQPFFPAQYGVSAIPSPPAVLYNSPAVAAAAAMNSQGGLYNAFQIEPSGRSQFSQFPGHYGTSGTAGPYNAYMTTPTNMQAGPTPEMFQSLSSQFRMGSVQSPYNQTTQMGNPNTMLISSNNSSLMSSSVKSSTQQIGAIGQPKPNGGGSVSQPPYGQQYLNMFPPAPPLQNSAANYYSNSGGNQTAFFGTAGATGAATQNAYGIPAAAVAASNMFGSHGGQNPSNTPQPPPPQQQMPSYSSQFLNSPLLAATNPAMNQQQYRGAPNNSSQHSGANAAAYIKSNQSPQSSHIQQQQQQQQQQDTWELQNQLMQHQPQISNIQQQSAAPQQLPLLSNVPAGGQQNSQANHSRNVLPLNQGNNQFVGCGNSTTEKGISVVVSGAGNGNTGTNSMRGRPQGHAGVSATRYPSPIQRPTSFTHAPSVGIQHHQQRCNRPIGYGQSNVGNNTGHQTAGSGSTNVAQGVNNSNKYFFGGNRG